MLIYVRLLLLRQIGGKLDISDARERINNLKEVESDFIPFINFVKEYCEEIAKTVVFMNKELSEMRDEMLKNDVLNCNDQISEVYMKV